jgi:hypothetical protein
MFTGEENHKITLEEGATLTANYRNTLMNLFGGIKGGYISKNAMKELLDQEGVVGFRYYYGLSVGLPVLPQIVVVGVDSDGNDLTACIILDKSLSCPPTCSVENPLNS